jgi:hypothetical protein
MKKLFDWLKEPIEVDPEPISTEEVMVYLKTKFWIAILWAILLVYLLMA